MESTCPHCGEKLEGQSTSSHICAAPGAASVTADEEEEWLSRPGTEGGANGGG